VMQCVAVCRSVCCSVAVCGSVVQTIARVYWYVVAVCCSVLQFDALCVAVCFSVWQCAGETHGYI